MVAKLKRLKMVLRSRNKEHFGDVHRNLEEAQSKISQLEVAYQSFNEEQDLIELNKHRALLIKAQSELNAFWKQKAKVRWLKERDANTQYFHNVVKENKCKIQINKIRDDEGMWTFDPKTIQGLGVKFYQTLLNEHELQLSHYFQQFIDCIPKLVTEEENTLVLQPFSMEDLIKMQCMT